MEAHEIKEVLGNIIMELSKDKLLFKKFIEDEILFGKLYKLDTIDGIYFKDLVIAHNWKELNRCDGQIIEVDPKELIFKIHREGGSFNDLLKSIVVFVWEPDIEHYLDKESENYLFWYYSDEVKKRISIDDYYTSLTSEVFNDNIRNVLKKVDFKYIVDYLVEKEPEKLI